MLIISSAAFRNFSSCLFFIIPVIASKKERTGNPIVKIKPVAGVSDWNDFVSGESGKKLKSLNIAPVQKSAVGTKRINPSVVS